MPPFQSGSAFWLAPSGLFAGSGPPAYSKNSNAGKVLTKKEKEKVEEEVEEEEEENSFLDFNGPSTTQGHFRRRKRRGKFTNAA